MKSFGTSASTPENLKSFRLRVTMKLAPAVVAAAVVLEKVFAQQSLLSGWRPVLTLMAGLMFNGFYKGKRVLVTGHTGFKGGWLSLWLHKLGASVWGVSLPPPTHPNLHEIIRSDVFDGEIECDVRELNSLVETVKKIQPEVI